jgi:hypothetical protein
MGEVVETQARTIRVRGGEIREVTVNVYPSDVLDEIAIELGIKFSPRNALVA